MIHIFDDYYITVNKHLSEYRILKKIYHDTNYSYEHIGYSDTFTQALAKLRERAFLREINNNDYEVNEALLIYDDIEKKINAKKEFY